MTGAAPLAEAAHADSATPLLAVDLGTRRVEFAELGHGSAVVLIHGSNCSFDDWANIAPRLAARHRVVMVDGLVHPLDPWLTWVLLDYLSVGSAALVGHSAGGMPAREMYRLQPHRVRGFVNIDSRGTGGMIRARDLPNSRFSAQAAALYERRRDQMLRLREDLWGDYPSAVNIEKRLRARARTAMTPEERGRTRPAPRLVGRGPEPAAAPEPIEDAGKFISCPVQVFHTGRGKLGPEDITPEWIATHIQATDVDYVVIREVSHWPWIEEPELFLSHLEPFLARTTDE